MGALMRLRWWLLLLTACGGSPAPSTGGGDLPRPNPLDDVTVAPPPGPKACKGSADCGPTEMCQGGDACGSVWTCGPMRACTRDLATYCGCDGKTFQASGSCPGQPFAHKGRCERGL
jgi:hypothetical protein